MNSGHGENYVNSDFVYLSQEDMKMPKEETSKLPVEVKHAVATVHPRHVRRPPSRQLFRQEMDRMFDRMFGPSMESFYQMEPDWLVEGSAVFPEPAVEMTEDAKAYTITAEVPGLEQKDIDVSLSGGLLSFKGEKREEKEEKGKNLYLSERTYGSFQRAFTLPDGVDHEKVSAELSKGVLKITLPKTTEAQKSEKKIEVKVAA